MSSLAKPTNPSSSSRFTNLTFLFVHLDFLVDAFNKRKRVNSLMVFSIMCKVLGLFVCFLNERLPRGKKMLSHR